MDDGYTCRIYEVAVKESGDTMAFTVLCSGESPDDAMAQIREEWPHAALWVVGLHNEPRVTAHSAEYTDVLEDPNWPRHLAMSEVGQELREAISKFPPMASPHEGYAILKEEVDELWEEVRRQYDVRDRTAMRKEAKQVAAMAVRFMMDVCEER